MRAPPVRRWVARTIAPMSATHIRAHPPMALHSGHIDAPDIGIPSGRPSSKSSTTRTMTAIFTTRVTVPPVRRRREGVGETVREAEAARVTLGGPALSSS
jgi:hypothetical protein